MNIVFLVDPNFVLKQFEAGKDLYPHNTIACQAQLLAPAQRKFIKDRIDALHASTDVAHRYDEKSLFTVVQNFQLTVPTFDKEKNAVIQTPWVGQVDHSQVGPPGVIDAWMKDYQEADKKAEKEYGKH
ncbi:MAG: hypothetical protein EOO38_18655 [Cytophagaceae bacterium]|nr:MAG: hypothetical protein EOO38_18655 [Cytophagaceae bacterium]